jgi:hypothetical protein
LSLRTLTFLAFFNVAIATSTNCIFIFAQNRATVRIEPKIVQEKQETKPKETKPEKGKSVESHLETRTHPFDQAVSEQRFDSRVSLESRFISRHKPITTASLRPSFLVILPRTEQAFKNIFGHERSASERLHSERIAQGFIEEHAQILGDDSLTKSSLQKHVEQSIRGGANPAVIIAHSVDIQGKRVIFLPSNEVVPELEVHRWAANVGGTLLVLTCYGQDFKLKERIGYEDALLMVRATKQASLKPIEANAEIQRNGEWIQFLDQLTGERWNRKARRMNLSVSYRSKISQNPNSAGDEVIVQRLLMERPQRGVWITLFLSFFIGGLHYTMWRVGKGYVDYRPTTTEMFRSAMVTSYQRLKAMRRLFFELAFSLFVTLAAIYLVGTEALMDIEDGSNGRWSVYLGSALGVLLLFVGYWVSRKGPDSSSLSFCAHGFAGSICGGSFAGFLAITCTPFLSLTLAIVIGGILWLFRLVFDPVSFGGMMRNWASNALEFGLFGGVFLLPFAAVYGIIRGWLSAIGTLPVHRSVWNGMMYFYDIVLTGSDEATDRRYASNSFELNNSKDQFPWVPNSPSTQDVSAGSTCGRTCDGAVGRDGR